MMKKFFIGLLLSGFLIMLAACQSQVSEDSSKMQEALEKIKTKVENSIPSGAN